jgi:hypothetical protein
VCVLFMGKSLRVGRCRECAGGLVTASKEGLVGAVMDNAAKADARRKRSFRVSDWVWS